MNCNFYRKLLKFGEVSPYLGYNALNDFFPKMPLQPNPTCSDNFCIKRQQEYQEILASKPADEVKNIPTEPEKIVHEDNIYGSQINSKFII